jgi:hypothetical protein
MNPKEPEDYTPPWWQKWLKKHLKKVRKKNESNKRN